MTPWAEESLFKPQVMLRSIEPEEESGFGMTGILGASAGGGLLTKGRSR